MHKERERLRKERQENRELQRGRCSVEERNATDEEKHVIKRYCSPIWSTLKSIFQEYIFCPASGQLIQFLIFKKILQNALNVMWIMFTNTTSSCKIIYTRAFSCSIVILMKYLLQGPSLQSPALIPPPPGGGHRRKGGNIPSYGYDSKKWKVVHQKWFLKMQVSEFALNIFAFGKQTFHELASRT